MVPILLHNKKDRVSYRGDIFMIHQKQTKGQEVGFGSNGKSFSLSFIHKSQSSIREKIERTLQGSKKYNDSQGLDTLILPYPQEWEETNYIQKPKEHFLQQQNRNSKVGYIVETYGKGSSLFRMKKSKVKPLEYHTQLPNHIRGDRKKSKGFSKKSRRNILTKVSHLGQDLIPPDRIKMITLTYDGREHFEKKYTPRDCKKHLNSFLTRLRKHLEGRVGRYFYLWRCEPQVKRYLRLGGNPVLHYHLTLFNVSYIDQDWVRETWSRIVCGWGDGKKPKDLVRTKTEEPRSWNRTNNYINKTLSYHCKDDVVEKKYKDYIRKKRLDPTTSHKRLKFLEQMSIGRVWGIGRYEDYNSFVDCSREELSFEEMSVLRRPLLKLMKSRFMKFQGENFNHKQWNQFMRYMKTGRITKKYKTVVIHLEQQFNELVVFGFTREMWEDLKKCYGVKTKKCVDEIKSDVVIDFTPDDYSRKVVGL